MLSIYKTMFIYKKMLWRHGLVAITTAQLHSTNPELRFCTGSSPARGVSEIRMVMISDNGPS